MSLWVRVAHLLSAWYLPLVNYKNSAGNGRKYYIAFVYLTQVLDLVNRKRSFPNNDQDRITTKTAQPCEFVPRRHGMVYVSSTPEPFDNRCEVKQGRAMSSTLSGILCSFAQGRLQFNHRRHLPSHGIKLEIFKCS